MKTKTTKGLKYLSALLLVVFLTNCKKESQPKPADPAPPTNINPLTAHTTTNYIFNDSTLINAGWTKTFEDNFDGDLSKWTVWTGGFSYTELECYQPGNVQIANGILQITAKKETVSGSTSISNTDTIKTFNYTSGGMLSKATISACTATPKVRIVARIKAAYGLGLASLFWSYGNYFPTQGVIDYAQIVGNDTHQYTTNYFIGSVIGQNQTTNSILFNPTDADLSADYHVYMMEWSQNALTSYIDGQLVETKTSGGHIADLFGKTENVSLALAVGGLYYNNLDPNTVQPGTMYVDYVKVFTSH